MKKLALTFAIVLGLGFGAMAQNGLFQRGDEAAQTRDGIPGFPSHGETGDQPAPVGSGIALLIGFGAAYAMTKKREK